MEERKKNILFVIPTLNSGGVELNLLEIAKQNYHEKKFNMFVLVKSGGFLQIRIENYNVKIINFDVATKNPFKMLFNVFRIKRIIKKYNIDIVSAESRAPAWSCYFACKKTNTIFSTTVHGMYNNGFFPFSFFKKKYNSIMVRSKNIICVSETVKNYIMNNFSKYIKDDTNLVVIPRGIDLDIFNPAKINTGRVMMMIKTLNIPNDKIIITLPARFSKIKGQNFFLKVIKKLSEMRNDFFCVLAGDTAKHPKFVMKLNKYIYNNNLSDFVGIYDNISDMATLYFLSTVIISSTITAESFGRVAIEAQAMGKIFIGTAVGATVELIENGKNGFLVPKNSIDTFVDTLNKVLNFDNQQRELIIQNALENAQKYSLHFMFNRTYNYYINRCIL